MRIQDQINHTPLPVPIPGHEESSDACTRVREWVEYADGDDFKLLLAALHIQVRAVKGHGELS